MIYNVKMELRIFVVNWIKGKKDEKAKKDFERVLC
jgi:hypothetical protein